MNAIVSFPSNGELPPGVKKTPEEAYQLIRENEHKYRLIAFARRVALGVPPVRAMKEAGYPTANRAYVAEILKDPIVVSTIEDELEHLRKGMLNSRESILAELDANREMAFAEGNPAAAIAATVAKAKILGYLDKDTSAAPKRITVEWNDEAGSHTETIGTKTLEGEALTMVTAGSSPISPSVEPSNTGSSVTKPAILEGVAC